MARRNSNAPEKVVRGDQAPLSNYGHLPCAQKGLQLSLGVETMRYTALLVVSAFASAADFQCGNGALKTDIKNTRQSLGADVPNLQSPAHSQKLGPSRPAKLIK
jgi:hypothetical protein